MNNRGLLYLAAFAIAMMVLQNILTYVQYKAFQKNAQAMRGKNRIVGVGVRKGGFNPKGGAILILAWDQVQDKVVECRQLSGIAFWTPFKVINDYDGMTLDDVRERGIAEDYTINKSARDKEPYRPNLTDKRRKKGALIQAVEAIDTRLGQTRSEDPKLGARTIDHNEQRARIEQRKREIRKSN